MEGGVAGDDIFMCTCVGHRGSTRRFFVPTLVFVAYLTTYRYLVHGIQCTSEAFCCLSSINRSSGNCRS